MPVDSEHKEFIEKKDDYLLIKASLAGERAIKKAGAAYVPMLSGQDEKAFAKYVERGSYYAAFGRSVKGLGGAILRRQAEIELPDALEELSESISSKGIGLQNIIQNSVDKVMSYGRHGLLVDMAGEDNQPYISEYNAEDIINWDVERKGGKEVLSSIVLKEIDSRPTAEDEFEYDEIERIRVLDIFENKYRVRLYEADNTSGAKTEFVPIEVYDGSGTEVFPKIRGKSLDAIPFFFLGPNDMAISPSKPPLLDLANLNISHWRMSVDYHYGLHLCALPTPYAIAFPSSEKLAIGPGKAWQSDDPAASCGFLEFTGEGLASVRTAMDSKVKEMAAVGARIVAEERAGIEAAETARIRQSGESATLTSISNTISLGITVAMKYVAEWMGLSSEDIVVKLNTDFVDKKLSPQEITALLSALQSNSISQDTFLYNLQQGEILPEKRTIEEEKDLIEAEGFEPFAPEEPEEEPVEEEPEEEPEEE